MAQLLRGSPTNKGFASIQPFFPTEGSGDRFAQWAAEVSDFLAASEAEVLGTTVAGKTTETSFNYQGGLVKIKSSKPGVEPAFAEVLIETKHPAKREVAERLAALSSAASALTATTPEIPSSKLDPILEPELELDLELDSLPPGPRQRGFFSLTGFKSRRGFSIAP